ncbi:MAG: CTB family bacteriocin [Goleter apudmare HA4340-LM2]|jgi:hypothetical protein|nr:CTB family bacteriocin [Goleter apudmare HA4340-LM2]MBW4642548.1 CTB family bacteriocin [Goleter apudmare HA4340-LM2]MBW4642549.1 CTB family bacteriocin [Goleter apudmare HA4340-LM2]MBW4642550.1 CTB family bacteriocin [Goleter apudmare HA4340-LM2]
MKVENQVAIELSSEELDVVAGGVDFLLDATQFKSNTLLVGQNTQSGPGGSSTTSTIARQVIDTSAFHNITLGV